MSISNISLYFKRAELFHTKEYIINTLRDYQYGDVDEVKFIKKSNIETGNEYYGAIVTFKSWFKSNNVQKLFEQMNSSPDGTAKIRHDYNGCRFWMVCQHQLPVDTKINSSVNLDLPDKERIAELEKLVTSMSAQMYFIQRQQEKNEQKFMEYEQNEIQSALINGELRSQLEEKEFEISVILTNTKMKVLDLTRHLETVGFVLEEKKIECDELREELYEDKNILEYIHKEANEMRDMLHFEANFRKSKMTIEELID